MLSSHFKEEEEKMKQTLILIWVCVAVMLFSSSCSVLQDECEKNNTGTFYVTNNSQKGKAYKILIDGINYDIVGAGATKEWTLSAGPHVVQIIDAATGNAACTASVPTVIKCQKNGLSCDG
jgi:hypothetical protein